MTDRHRNKFYPRDTNNKLANAMTWNNQRNFHKKSRAFSFSLREISGL